MQKTLAIRLLFVIIAIYVILHVLYDNLHILPLDPHIKQVAWAVFIISGILLLLLYLAPFTRQPPLKHPVSLPDAQVQQVKLIKYGFNRIGDIDKFLIVYQNRETWIHFPPHTAKYVMKTAPKNASAEINFHITDRIAADGKPMYDLVTVKAGGQIFETSSIPPPKLASGKSLELTGKILDYKLDEKGSMAGFTMDKYIIEIPKHLAVNIIPMLKDAKEIVIKGYERNATDGFVNSSGLVLIKPYAITIDKTYYLL